MTAPRTQYAWVTHEVGGHDIRFKIRGRKGSPATLEEPEEEDEFEVVEARLIVDVRGLQIQTIDILDLLCEVAGGELPDDLLIELNDKLGDSE